MKPEPAPSVPGKNEQQRVDNAAGTELSVSKEDVRGRG